MAGHTETELKLQCTNPSIWTEILTAPWLTGLEVAGSRQTIAMEAWYYDTPSLAFRKAKLAFRIRREGENWVATIKGGGSSQGGLHQRQEYNVEVQGAAPAINVFAGNPLGDTLLALAGREELQPVLITRFTRQLLVVRLEEGSVVEVAADKGEIIAGGQSQPILEVELELKEGQVSSLLALGDKFIAAYSLKPEQNSKYYRGLVLAGLETVE